MVDTVLVAGSIGAVLALDAYAYYVYSKSKRKVMHMSQPKQVQATPALQESMQRMVEAIKQSSGKEEVTYLGSEETTEAISPLDEGFLDETFIEEEKASMPQFEEPLTQNLTIVTNIPKEEVTDFEELKSEVSELKEMLQEKDKKFEILAKELLALKKKVEVVKKRK